MTFQAQPQPQAPQSQFTATEIAWYADNELDVTDMWPLSNRSLDVMNHLVRMGYGSCILNPRARDMRPELLALQLEYWQVYFQEEGLFEYLCAQDPSHREWFHNMSLLDPASLDDPVDERAADQDQERATDQDQERATDQDQERATDQDQEREQRAN